MSHPYARREYASSLRQLGRAIEVPEWGCSVLARSIGEGLEDAIGSYPITVLEPGADLSKGLTRLRDAGLVSVVLVLDDFHRPPLDRLRAAFPVFRPFKTHYVRRLSGETPAYEKHHRYEIRRALKSVEVRALDLARDGEAWNELYATLAARHQLTGVHAFPLEHVGVLAAIDGFEAIGAWAGGELVSAHIWARHQARVHSHLAASSETGYALGAAYAVNDFSIRLFAEAELINFGGAAGTTDAFDGLARFKSGFANGSAASYLCGAVLRPDLYGLLAQTTNIETDSTFFPAYRAPRKEAAR